MSVPQTTSLQDRIIREVDNVSKHDPTWKGQTQILKVDRGVIPTDDTDYDLPIEFWLDNRPDEQRVKRLTQVRTYRLAKRMYEEGAFQRIRTMEEQAKSRKEHLERFKHK